MNTEHPLLACVVLGASAAAASVHASETAGAPAPVHVAANGVDVSPCGTAANPCRSISFGIAQAFSGGTILVGPGRYGDLDGDGALGSPGEESGEVGFGCLCVVRVDKAVRILSTQGAEATIIDASGLTAATIPVLITANNAQLGRRDQGFLLKGWPNFTAVYVLHTTGVTVAGNLATASSNGFFLDGGSGNVLEHNFAYANTVGFELGGSDQTVRFNRASSNIAGFIVGGSRIRIVGNIAAANDEIGFVVGAGPDVTLTRNLTTGNRFTGIQLNAGATALINRNNIYGNFCGIFNRSNNTIDGTGNYWGAPSGPGPDPADDVCDDEIDDITVVRPFSRRPIPLPTSGVGGQQNP